MPIKVNRNLCCIFTVQLGEYVGASINKQKCMSYIYCAVREVRRCQYK